jgi:hypothetical protein
VSPTRRRGLDSKSLLLPVPSLSNEHRASLDAGIGNHERRGKNGQRILAVDELHDVTLWNHRTDVLCEGLRAFTQEVVDASVSEFMSDRGYRMNRSDEFRRKRGKGSKQGHSQTKLPPQFRRRIALEGLADASI